jgi:hypothetical protein
MASAKRDSAQLLVIAAAVGPLEGEGSRYKMFFNFKPLSSDSVAPSVRNLPDQPSSAIASAYITTILHDLIFPPSTQTPDR